MTPKQGHTSHTAAPDPDLRLAGPQDIDRLLEICAEAFPHSLLWSGDHPPARSWWQDFLARDFTAVWVAEDAGRIIGFAAILSDEKAWLDRVLAHPMTPAQKLGRVLRHPGRLLARWRYKNARGADISAYPTMEFNLPGTARVFVEHFAVAGEGQGRGIARALVAKVEQETRAMGRQAVMYNVDRTNLPMQRLMLSLGYALWMHRRHAQLSFVRVLEPAA